MRTRSKCIEILREKGFTEDFTPAPRFRIHLANKTYSLHEMKISAFYQYDQSEDSTLPSVLFAIETYDGKRGILIGKEAEFTGDRVSEFIHAVNEARKKSKKFSFLQPVKWLIRFSFSKN